MDTQTQVEISRQDILKDLTEIRAGWIDMGHHYMDDLVKIILELGNPITCHHSVRFTTQNLTLLYRMDESYVPLGGIDSFNNPFHGHTITVMVTAGNIVDFKDKSGKPGRDADLQLREFKVAVLHSSDFDLKEAGMPEPYELFIPNFMGWLDEALSYLPEANHRIELRMQRILDAEIEKVRNELFVNGPVRWLHAPNVAR